MAWNVAAAEVWGQSSRGALRAAGAPGVSGEKRGRGRLVAQPLRPSSLRATASLSGSSSSPPLLPLPPSLPTELAAPGASGRLGERRRQCDS